MSILCRTCILTGEMFSLALPLGWYLPSCRAICGTCRIMSRQRRSHNTEPVVSGRNEGSGPYKGQEMSDQLSGGPHWSPMRVFGAAAFVLLLLAIAAIWQAQPGRLPTALREHTSLYIAANLYNNEDILPRFSTEVLRLVSLVGAHNLYISVFENGSTDDTKAGLARLQHDLAHAGVQHTIITSNATWRNYLPHVNGPHRVTHPPTAGAASGAGAGGGPPSHPFAGAPLRGTDASSRIPIMARVRNEALKPLWGAPWLAAHAQQRSGPPAPLLGSTWMESETGQEGNKQGVVQVENPLYAPLFGGEGGVLLPQHGSARPLLPVWESTRLHNGAEAALEGD
jgi:hypothetical protein